jgi:hypothetical protein
VASVGCRREVPPEGVPRADSGGRVAKEKQPVAVVLEPDPERCPSLIQLLVYPDRYHGKEIQVKGYLVVEDEGTAIYVSESDGEYYITPNGFWVEFEGNTLGLSDKEITKRFHHKYVLLEGTFDKDDRGHEDLWQGSIGKVSRLMTLPSLSPRLR